MEVLLALKHFISIISMLIMSTTVFAVPNDEIFPPKRFVYNGTNSAGITEYIDLKSYQSNSYNRTVLINFYYDSTKTPNQGYAFAIVRHRIDCNKLEQNIERMGIFDKNKKLIGSFSGKDLNRDTPVKFELGSKFGTICAGAFGVKI